MDVATSLRTGSVGKAVRKYLEGYAEPEARRVAGLVEPVRHDSGSPFDHVLVIPARREAPRFLERVLPAGVVPERLLVIVVVNGTTASTAADHSANAATLAGLRAAGRCESLGDGIELVSGTPTLLLVDRASESRRFADGEGVGLARRIGADVALAIAVTGGIDSRWIHTSDADAVQTRERFVEVGDRESARAAREGDAVAIVFPYRHASADPRLHEAGLLYEIGLRSWVLGLRAAGSAWDFPTIGSTITVRSSAYAHVRGFPRRIAAEDFYLLAKLAKLGPIRQAAGPPLLLESRPSDRMPFGTGPAIARIVGGGADDRSLEHAIADPRVFDLLGRWIASLEKAAPGDAAGARRSALADLSARDAAALSGTLKSLGAVESLEAIARERPGGNVLHAFHTWFDAFRTMKFLRGLRDRGFPDVPWGAASRWVQGGDASSGTADVSVATASGLAAALAALEEEGFPRESGLRTRRRSAGSSSGARK